MRALFIDRDGVIVEERQVDSLEVMHFIPHVMEALRQIRRMTDFELVMVSNQDGVGTPSFPLASYELVQERILEVLRGEDVAFDDINVDFSLPEDKCPGRKPGTAMLSSYMDGGYELDKSFVIGDRLTDMALAKALGARGIWFHAPDGDPVPDDLAPVISYESDDWLAIAHFLCGDEVHVHRTARITRKTKETGISLALDIDGSGKGRIRTGIGFFDHMLEQVVKHGRLDVEATCEGDLEVDEHHSVEDMALVFGEAFKTALGDKKGIERYGYEILCMDEVHASVAIDFSGRPCLSWDVDFCREYVGSFPTEMVRHFFKSFSDSAACNLHMEVSAGNCHHQVEALFKAFARAVRRAVRRIPGSDEPASTKGVL